jgi:hypothetical protein
VATSEDHDATNEYDQYEDDEHRPEYDTTSSTESSCSRSGDNERIVLEIDATPRNRSDVGAVERGRTREVLREWHFLVFHAIDVIDDAMRRRFSAWRNVRCTRSGREDAVLHPREVLGHYWNMRIVSRVMPRRRRIRRRHDVMLDPDVEIAVRSRNRDDRFDDDESVALAPTLDDRFGRVRCTVRVTGSV